MFDKLFKEYADIPALEEQTAKIINMFDSVEQGLLRLSEIGLKIDTAGSTKQVSKLADEYDGLSKIIEAQNKQMVTMAIKLAAVNTEEGKKIEALKQVTNLTKGLVAEEIKRQKLQAGEYATLQQAKQENAELNKSIQLRIKLRHLTETENGSLRQRQTYYNKLYGIVQKLNDAQRDTTRGRALVKLASDLKEQLNSLKKDAGDFSSNVGRYAESLGGLFDGVREELEKLQARQKELTERKTVGGFLTSKQQEELERLPKAINELNNVMAIGNTTGGTYKQTLGKIGFELQNMAASGNQSNEFLEKFKKETAVSANHARELTKELKAIGSGTRSLDLAVSAVSTLASTFEAVSGGMALFGKSEEDVHRVTQKLIAIQSVANGIREVGKQITEKGTAANKAYNFVLKQGEVIFGKNSTAAQRFGAALKGIGIIAVITLIYKLIESFDIFGESAEDAAEKLDKLNQELDTYGSLQDKIINITAKTPIDNNYLKYLQAQLDIRKAQGASLQEQFELEKKIADEERDLAQKQLDDLEAKAFAEIGYTDITLRGYDLIEAAQQKAYDDFVSATAELKSLYGQRIRNRETLTESELENYDLEIKKQQQLVNEAERNYNHYNTVIENASQSEIRIRELVEANNKRIRDEERKAALELFKFRQDLTVKEKQLQTSPDAPYSLDFKVQAAKDAAEAEKAIIKEQLKYDLEQNDLANSQRILLRERAAEAIRDIEYELSNNVIHIYEDEAKRRKKLIDQSVADFEQYAADKAAKEAEARQKAFQKEQDQLAINQADQLRLNIENYQEGFKTKEEFNQRKLQIENDYQRLVLESQIRFYEAELKLLQANGEDTTALLKAIAEAKAQLAELGFSKTTSKIDEEKAALDQLKDKYKELADAMTNAFESVVVGSFERQKNAIQDLIDKNDELREKEILRVQQSTDSEQEKANKIAVIDAAAQARKEALERRQRQIDRQKAIFERGFKVFEITTDNITAINKIQVAAAAAVNPAVKALLLAQIPLTIATGAVGLLALLATPIPKYYTGTESSVGGLAEVAEQGRELAIEPSGNVKMFTRRGITNLVKGTKIYSNRVTEDIIASANKQLYTNVWEKQEPDKDRTDEVIYELQQIRKTKAVHMHVAPGIEVSDWFIKNFKR